MPAQISVQPTGTNEFRVTVSEGSTQTSHLVTVQPKDYQRITSGIISGIIPGQIGESALLKIAFEFLLEHEPKESILRSFDLMVIARYFPAFENEMSRRLSQR